MGNFAINVDELKFANIVNEMSVLDIFDFQNNNLQVKCLFKTADEFQVASERINRNTDEVRSTSNMSYTPWKRNDLTNTVSQSNDRQSLLSIGAKKIK